MSERGLLNSASSMTNLTTESEVSLQRTLSASELCDASYGGHRSRNKQQRTKDLRHSIADSRSDYYNFRRPQSVSLGSQLPAFPTTLHSASSASALGTISENEATCGSTPYIEFTHDSDGESIFGDPPDTPIFNYNPISSVAKVNRQSRGSPPPTQERIYASLSLQPQVESSGHEQLSRTRSNGYVNVPTTTAPIHASEPITQEFVPLYLNPLTGQMYSHNQDYFRPISSPNEVITKPPKPDKRLEDGKTAQSSYIRFTAFLAILFLLCGNIFVLVACSLPAICCAHQVHQLTLQKRYREAQKHSEYVLCFNALGIVLHVVLMLGAIISAVVVAVIVVQ